MADLQDSFTFMASDNQADTCSDCGEPLLMMGEWQLVRGICPNWNRHTLVNTAAFPDRKPAKTSQNATEEHMNKRLEGQE